MDGREFSELNAFVAVARQLSLAPAQIAYLGDSDVDMLAARAAGMLAAGALWGFRSAEELKRMFGVVGVPEGVKKVTVV